MPLTHLKSRLQTLAKRLGFSLFGVCPAAKTQGYSRLREWLAAGYAGEMDYFARRIEAYAHPRHVLPEARSLVMIALPYALNLPGEGASGQVRVARYAQAPDDYHDRIHDRLKILVRYLERRAPGTRSRGVVDTAPLLEREYASLAGLGWQGKNTLTLHRGAGSYFFLAAVLTTVELAPDQPHTADHCGTCRACLEACPTRAFPAPYVLDATRCISYLTIETRGPIPPALRESLGGWIFGCDVCQEVCPWNAHAQPRVPNPPEPEFAGLDPCQLLKLDEAAFRRQFRRTPYWRPGRTGMLRNAALVLGNLRPSGALAALAHGLQDTEPVVRGACAWALGRFEVPEAREILRSRAAIENDAAVRHEIEAALGNSPRQLA